MKKIRLFLTGLLLMVAAAAYAQDIEVSGTVSDASTGEGIAGATILLKGTTTEWVMTDAMGSYTITVPSDGVLEVRFMGYTTVEVPVNGRSTVDIAMELETEMLDDVVVVGYGSARKISSVVGSASTVNKKVVANRPTANAGDALQGQVSGLQVFSSSGEPSENVSMRLRGVNSINAGNTPLIVLDGAPVSSAVFGALNSNDIESIVVMKDASSTAIYGSRAANGVIYITTKKGQRGEKPTVTLRGQYGISTLLNHRMNLMETEDWFAFNEKVNPNFVMTDKMRVARELGINTDWMHYFFNEAAPMWSADISVSGASEKTDYYFSLGAFDQTGTAPNSYLSRYNFRMNVNTQATDWLKMGANFGLMYQNYEAAGFTDRDNANNLHNPVTASEVFATWVSPYEIRQDEGGNYYVDYSSPRKTFNEYVLDGSAVWNTLYLQEMQPNNTNIARLNGSTYIQLTPIKGLVLRAQQNIEAFDYRYSYKQNPDPEGPFGDGTARAAESFQRYYQLTFTNTAEYTFDIADRNNFIILLGQESIFDKNEAFSASAQGYTDWRNNLLSQGSTPLQPGYSISETSYNSYFVRLSYNLDDKYYVDASWRLDGSSLFGEGNQYANFYSIGAMWDIKKENWMRGASWLNDLRLKASYGTTGNSSISPYMAIGTIGTTTNYEGVPGWGIGNVSNNGLTWETVESVNVGVSARLWNFMNVNVDFYNKVTHDLLMEIPFSMTTGHSGGWGNGGDMLNRGVDVDLSFDVIQTNDIYFGVTANFNYNYNEILSLVTGDEYTLTGTGISYQPGYPYGELFYVRTAGVDPRDGMQMWYDKDGNKTKVFTEDNAVMTGKQRFAPWSGGLQLNFQWKGLYVGADFTWVAGKWTINNDRYFLMSPDMITGGYNGVKEMLNIWTEPGDITDIPTRTYKREFDDTYIENASFLKLKNVQISYEFPKNLIQRSGFISGFRIYAIARNLLTFTEYSGFDPEVDSNLQLGVYPNSRQFTIGAEFTF